MVARVAHQPIQFLLEGGVTLQNSQHRPMGNPARVFAAAGHATGDRQLKRARASATYIGAGGQGAAVPCAAALAGSCAPISWSTKNCMVGSRMLWKDLGSVGPSRTIRISQAHRLNATEGQMSALRRPR